MFPDMNAALDQSRALQQQFPLSRGGIPAPPEAGTAQPARTGWEGYADRVKTDPIDNTTSFWQKARNWSGYDSTASSIRNSFGEGATMAARSRAGIGVGSTLLGIYFSGRAAWKASAPTVPVQQGLFSFGRAPIQQESGLFSRLLKTAGAGIGGGVTAHSIFSNLAKHFIP